MNITSPDESLTGGSSAVGTQLKITERSFLIGGILVLFVLGVMALLGIWAEHLLFSSGLQNQITTGGANTNQLVVAISKFHLPSAVFALALGLINLKSWVFFVSATGDTSLKGSKLQLLAVGQFVLAKTIAIILAILFIKTAVPAKILSALVGFTLFLFFGSFAVLLEGGLLEGGLPRKKKV